MTLGDEALLLRVSAALSGDPFAARVDIGGGIMLDRGTARAIERQLLRQRVEERRRLRERETSGPDREVIPAGATADRCLSAA